MGENASTPGPHGQSWLNKRTVANLLIFLFLIVLLAVLVRSKGDLLLWEIAFGIIALFLWPLLQGTYLLYARYSEPIHADYKATDATFFERLPGFQVSALKRLGFTFAGCLERDRENPRVAVDIALFIQTENKDLAQIAHIRSSVGTRELLVFSTKFDDGLVLETSDLRGRPLFRPKPKYPVYRFPQMRNAADLYLLHQKIKQEFSGSRKPGVLEASERINAFQADAEEIHRLNREQGDYKMNRSGERYVFTVRGAFRHRFLRTWPVNFIRDILAERDAIKKCRVLGFEINPKIGGIEPLK
jgi:hypothetical protein